MNLSSLPVGKLPPELLARILQRAPLMDQRVILGPGIGLDCAVVDMGSTLLVFKSDPITFVSDQIGWYAVQVSANDVATTGAVPRWYLATVLLPENNTSPELVEEISEQIFRACSDLGISVIGGHTEITHRLDRPILCGTLIGEVERPNLVTPHGVQPGDSILLTKSVPIEATSILAREFPDRLKRFLSPSEIEEAAGYLKNPGISVVRDAAIALNAGKVTSMHDPTEGGLASALWELAEAGRCVLEYDPDAVPVSALSQKICREFGLNPLAAIASGALLFTTTSQDSKTVQMALQNEGISCTIIGTVLSPSQTPAVWQQNKAGRALLSRPNRDDITKVYEEKTSP